MDDPSMNAPASPVGSVHDQATLPPGQSVPSAPLADAPHSFVISPGTELGDYELQVELGRGGMGVVYRARQKSLNRVVAVKLILAGRLASTQDIERFHAEAEAAAALDHPGIIPIYEVGESQGQHFFSMAYVAGQNLATRVDRGPLIPSEAAESLRQLAEAVEYAHQQGILHRDIKPGNILLDAQGRPRITDFGLAKRWQAGEDHSSLKDVCGTVSYMPPEQAEGQSERIGPPSDVYALGATLYCLLTGRPPFQSANPIDTLLQVVQQSPVPPRQLNPAIPIDLETICLKCLEKDPARRYLTAAALGEDLQRFLNDQPILARPPSAWEQLRRWSRQHPGLALSGFISAAAILALLLVSVLYNFLLQGEKMQARAATLEAQRLQKSTQLLLDQLAQVRQSERALDVLQFAEYGRLCVLAHHVLSETETAEASTTRQELLTLVETHQERADGPLRLVLDRMLSHLQASEPLDPAAWSPLTSELTRQCRDVWLASTASVPALRDQVRQVVTTRLIVLAQQLADSGREHSSGEILAEIRDLARGDLAIVSDTAVLAASATFLEEFQPDRKPLSSTQLRSAIETLKQQCESSESVIPAVTL